MRYFVGRAGDSGRGKLHLFPEDPESDAARLRTICSVEDRVGFLLRSRVNEEDGPRELDELTSQHGGELCRNCTRRADGEGE